MKKIVVTTIGIIDFILFFVLMVKRHRKNDNISIAVFNKCWRLLMSRDNSPGVSMTLNSMWPPRGLRRWHGPPHAGRELQPNPSEANQM